MPCVSKPSMGKSAQFPVGVAPSTVASVAQIQYAPAGSAVCETPIMIQDPWGFARRAAMHTIQRAA